MKNKTRIFIVIIVIAFIVLMLFPIKTYCISQLVTSMNGASNVDGTNNSITRGLNAALSLVRYVGSGVSVIVVLLLGIKYMIASIEEKVEIKKRAVPIVIGCIIVFATTNLLVIIDDIVGQL